jgi:hypothetical protein
MVRSRKEKGPPMLSPLLRDDLPFPEVVEIPPLEPWRKTLLDAADLLEEKGWIQDSYQTCQGYCMLGAIQYVLSGDAIKYTSLWTGDHTILKVLQNTTGTVKIWEWNDARGRTKDEVLQAIRKAATSVIT